MVKANKYAQAAFEVLTEMGGGEPIRSGDLVKQVYEKTDIEEGKYTYHYILKACKEDSRFDTSQRGRIGLAAEGAVGVDTSMEEEVSEEYTTEEVDEVLDTPGQNFLAGEDQTPSTQEIGEASPVSSWGKSF